MRICALVVLISINLIRARMSSELNFCAKSTDVGYDRYFNSTKIQNCGCEKQETCIRKCCQIGFDQRCGQTNEDSSKRVCLQHAWSDFNVSVYDGKIEVREETQSFLIGMLNCNTNNTNVRSVKMNEFFIQNNGSLYYPKHDLMLDNERYCIDENDGLTAHLCLELNSTNGYEATIQVTTKLISVPFLMFTGIVYALLPERNLHRIALMHHVLTLSLGNVLLVDGLLTVIEDNNLCYCLALSILLFMIASFCWMNVICIDIWLAFSGLRSYYVHESLRRIFTIASVYAWGLPILNILIVFLLNAYGDKYSEYHPGIVVKSCFLKDGPSTLIFYFGPVVVIIIINIVLFILTAFNIQKVKKETRIVQDSERKKHSKIEHDKFKLYWKLLFVMGLNPVVNTHVFQLVSWYAEKKWDNVAVYISYYKDFAHAAYGILIFVIFVCQKRIWRALRERFHRICKSNKSGITKTSVTTSSITSHSENDQSEIYLQGIQNRAADVP